MKIKGLMNHASEKDMRQIEEMTIQQNGSEIWHKARYCRITASKCHDVMTRMKTLEKDKLQNTDKLLRRLLYGKKICTSAMEKGRKWEEYAFNRYKTVMEIEGHCDLRVTKCGLVISKDVILGASPDGLVSCQCHGKGVLEIKNATKFEHKDPNEKDVIDKIPYLERNGTMKRNHKYFSQVQFQMGIVGRSWCHLVVFTPKCLEKDVKPLIVHVAFDKTWYEKLVETSKQFWYEKLLPEIIEKKILRESSNREQDIPKNNDHGYAFGVDSGNSSGNNCPLCHVVCKNEEEVNTFNERSIGCDSCNAWFHFGCVQMTKKKLNKIGEENWYCRVCVKENK